MSLFEPPVCVECGARQKGAADRFCAYCGTQLPRAPTEAELRVDERRARFDVARGSAAYQRALARTPSAAGQLGGGLFQVLFLAFFVLVTLGIGGSACSVGAFAGGVPFGAIGGLFALVPLGMATFAIVALIGAARRTARVATSATLPMLALVKDERTQVSGGGRDSSASTSYFATLEFEDGRREEFPVSGRISGRVTPGDIGVAYERGGALIDFTLLDA